MTDNNDKKLKAAIETIRKESLTAGFYGVSGFKVTVENGNIQELETMIKKKHK